MIDTYVHSARGDLRPVLDQKALKLVQPSKGPEDVWVSESAQTHQWQAYKNFLITLTMTTISYLRTWSLLLPDNANKCFSHNDLLISSRKCLHTSSYWNSVCYLPLISFQSCFPSKRSSQSPLHSLSILITCHAKQTKTSSAFLETKDKIVLKKWF